MNKRNFIKTTAAATAGTILPGLSACKEDKNQPILNWAGNLTYHTKNIDYPNTMDELIYLIKKKEKVKILGTQHCFNDIADSKFHLISTKNLNEVVSIDKNKNTVTVEPGIKYGTLAEYLHREGYALNNLASLPHISIAGACATATHGSGIQNGNLATQVAGLELALADGSVKSFSRETDRDAFNAVVVNLGALGAVTKMTLAIEPSFDIRQDVFENLSVGELEKNFESIMSKGYSVSLFTDWMNNNVSEVWVKSKISTETPFIPMTNLYGATPATKNIHPIIELDAINCTDQMGVPGPWHERLPHFKMDFTPSSGKELQAEFFIPFENGIAAYKAINDHGAEWKNDLFISEVRTAAADDLWMSTTHKRTSLIIHFTWKQQENVYKLIPKVEALLKPFGARPHWGKLFNFDKSYLQSVYPRYHDFNALVKELDPKGKFRNEYLEKVLF